MGELSKLHEVAMEPTQEEEDWMLFSYDKGGKKEISYQISATIV